MGVSNYNGTCTVNYLSENTIRMYDFPEWVRGCNSINSYHSTVSSICNSKGLDISQIIERDEVEVTTLYKLMINHCVEGVYFLKIDTEGHDTTILKKFYEECERRELWPHVIQFESNSLSNMDEVNHIIEIFTGRGYDIIHMGYDTILNLNLCKLANKSVFTEQISKYFIYDYPANYNVADLPHENTLEGAKEYCIKHNCTGVTLQDGVYQVRNGTYMHYFDGDIHSWVFL